MTLTAQSLASTPVQNVGTLPAPNQSVGYMLFNDHIGTSEAQLVAAIDTLKAAAVTDLVLDVRYNGGGYLDIAAELAYMIAGPANTNGKFFERLNYNNRNPFDQSTSERTTVFHSTGQGFTVPGSRDLPFLGLSRVFVLTSGDTCSASEAIVNGLRGAGVTVHLVGSTTCGKPYGFFPQDNCGTTYFAIQFQGVNQLGFGDYADGIAPTCAVADDFTQRWATRRRTSSRWRSAAQHRGLHGADGDAGAGAGRREEETRQGGVVRTPARENRTYRTR